jgi:serine-type D-Ala-D-Ala carboxypeptidase/endopeptidase (penicillin-binding protein 4)
MYNRFLGLAKRLITGSAALLALLASAACSTAAPLASSLNALMGDPSVKGAQVSINIVEITPNGPTELYSHNPSLPLAPASNVKLLTTGAAFEKYGPKAAFRTLLYRAGNDLIVVGSGDPALGDPKLCAEAGWTVTTLFQQWAGQLQKVGVKSYGDLIVDDSVFDQQFIHPAWPEDQLLSWYEAPVGGLNFNDNCLDWLPTVTARGVGAQLIPPTTYVSLTNKAKRGGETRAWLWRPSDHNTFELRGTIAANGHEPESVTIVEPGLWSGTVIRDTLASAGVASTGTVRRSTFGAAAPPGTAPQLIATFETPLLSILKRANKNSVNLMAEALCKRLGHDTTGKPGTWADGTAAVRAYVTGLGVPADSVTLDDGSGLSPANKVSAAAFTTVLAHVAARPDGDLFVNTLAIPGEDGTLQHRFKGMRCAKGVHAKTGHISGVSTLSGYLDVGSRRFAFSILTNNKVGNANPWQDRICQTLWDWVNAK